MTVPSFFPNSLAFGDLKQGRRGFSLIEILSVMAILIVLASAAVPMFAYLREGNMQTVSVQTHGTLESARQFALANRTYVRAGFADIEGNVTIQCVHSTTGNLDHATAADFANEAYWRSTDKPLILRGVALDKNLVRRLPQGATTVDAFRQASGADTFPAFKRKSGSEEITYSNVIQFDPLGQISIDASSPVRSAVIGLANPRHPQDPVGFLLFGYSGTIQGFRQEDLVK